MMRGAKLVNRLAARFTVLVVIALSATPSYAEDGYDLWLRFAPLDGVAAAKLKSQTPVVAPVSEGDRSSTLDVAVEELERGLTSLQGEGDPLPAQNPVQIILDCGTEPGTGQSGFSLTPQLEAERPTFRIAAQDHIGCLYGSYALLRELAAGRGLGEISLIARQPCRCACSTIGTILTGMSSAAMPDARSSTGGTCPDGWINA